MNASSLPPGAGASRARAGASRARTGAGASRAGAGAGASRARAGAGASRARAGACSRGRVGCLHVALLCPSPLHLLQDITLVGSPFL